MAGPMLDLKIELSEKWRRLEHQYGRTNLEPFLHEFIRELGRYLVTALRSEYDVMYGRTYSGGMKNSIFSKEQGRLKLVVGLDLRRGRTRTWQALQIYAMSQLKGWQPIDVPIGVILGRLLPWVRQVTGKSGREAKDFAFNIVASWLRQGAPPGRNFVAKVLIIPQRGIGFRGTIASDYLVGAFELQNKFYERIERELSIR